MANSNIPLKLEGSLGDLREMTNVEQNYLAYQAGLKLASDSDLTGSLTLSSSGNTLIGSLTNTFFNQPVGTHPGSSISSGSTTTNLYQVSGPAEENNSTLFRRPIGYSVSGIEGIHEMVDSDLNELSDRLNSRIHLSDYPGVRRLASSSPGADYSVEISNLFTDTRTDGHSLQYNIYKRNTMTPPSAVRCVSLRLSNGDSGDFEGLQEMTDAQINYSLGQRCKTRQSISGNIGSYQLRSSAQGAPVSPGTWTSKGSATDTKNTTVETAYTRTRTSSYTRTSIADFSRSFVGNYIGNYSRIFTGNYSRTFIGDFTGDFVGNYSRTFIGNYSRNFVGNYTGDFVGNYIGDFTGNYSRTFIGNYVGNYSRTFVGNYSRNFVGNYSRTFVGNYAGDFIGNYSRSNFIRTSVRNFTSISTVFFSSSVDFVRVSTVPTMMMATQYTGNYVSVQVYARTYVGITRSSAFIGEYIGPPLSYSRNSTATSINNSVVNFNRTRVSAFSRNRVSTYSADYTRNRISTYTRNSVFDFTRNSTAVFTRTRVSSYILNRDSTYTRTSIRNSTQNRISTYSRNRISTYSADYTRTRISAYTGNFVGNYSRNFVGNYIGTTIDSGTTTIETYTLYVRTA